MRNTTKKAPVQEFLKPRSSCSFGKSNTVSCARAEIILKSLSWYIRYVAGSSLQFCTDLACFSVAYSTMVKVKFYTEQWIDHVFGVTQLGILPTCVLLKGNLGENKDCTWKKTQGTKPFQALYMHSLESNLFFPCDIFSDSGCI